MTCSPKAVNFFLTKVPEGFFLFFSFYFYVACQCVYTFCREADVIQDVLAG